MTDWDKKIKEEGQEMARKMTDMLNSCGRGKTKAFIEAMNREHRYLQQQFTTLCMEWFLSQADKKPHEYDGRNAHGVRLAKKLREAM